MIEGKEEIWITGVAIAGMIEEAEVHEAVAIEEVALAAKDPAEVTGEAGEVQEVAAAVAKEDKDKRKSYVRLRRNELRVKRKIKILKHRARSSKLKAKS